MFVCVKCRTEAKSCSDFRYPVPFKIIVLAVHVTMVFRLHMSLINDSVRSKMKLNVVHYDPAAAAIIVAAANPVVSMHLDEDVELIDAPPGPWCWVVSLCLHSRRAG